MASDNKNNSVKPYEQNTIGLKGIVFFGVGLFLLIVVTFALMWAMKGVLEDNAVATDAEQKRPLSLSAEERLPPEPRLQGAPGFKVDGPLESVSLELTIPQAEYRELQRQWDVILRDGRKVSDKDGQEVVVSLPIEEAKAAYLEEIKKTNVVRQGERTDRAVEDASTFVSYASAGRLKVDKRK